MLLDSGGRRSGGVLGRENNDVSMPSSPAPKTGEGERLDNEWREAEEKGSQS
jgi:hypothetical protein